MGGLLGERGKLILWDAAIAKLGFEPAGGDGSFDPVGKLIDGEEGIGVEGMTGEVVPQEGVLVSDMFTVPADGMGHHSSDGLTVHDLEVSGEGIGEGVADAEHGGFDSHTGEAGTPLHLESGLGVVRFCDNAWEALGQISPGFAGVEGGDGVSFFGYEGFEGVGEGIDTGEGGDARGLGSGEIGVEDSDSAGGFGVSAGHFDVGICIADEGEGLGFASGPGGGGDADEGEHWVGGFADAPVVFDSAAAGVEEVDSFRAIHGATAAETDEEVGLKGLGEGDTAIDIEGGWVFVEVVEGSDMEAGLFEREAAAIEMSGLDDPRIADDEDAGGVELFGQFT